MNFIGKQKILIIAFIIIQTFSFGQAPPNPPGDPSSGGGPVGGTAPIGGGIEILLAMSVGFAVRKTYTFFQSNTDKKEVF